MRRPGERLRRAVARWCSEKTLRQRVDPVIADLQCEHRQALQHGRRWRARWIRFAAYAALSKVFVLTTVDAAASFFSHLRECATDWTALRRGLAIALGVGTAIVALEIASLLEMVTGDVDSNRAAMVLYLVPHALWGAIPIAMLIAVAALAPTLSRAHRAGVVALAGACCVVALLNIGWITPAANQAFRVEASGDPRIRRGHNELTLVETRTALIRGYSEADAATGPIPAQRLAAAYYRRWAMAFAPLALTVFALTVRSGTVARRLLLAMCVGAAFIYYPWGLLAALGLPAALVAWLPNVAVGLFAARDYLFTARAPDATT